MASDLTFIPVLKAWLDKIVQWSLDGSLLEAAEQSSLIDKESSLLNNVIGDWAKGSFVFFPSVKLLSSESMNGALGAYSSINNEIYLNSDWHSETSAPLIISVLTEELGHHINAVFAEEDVEGDEGAIFSALLEYSYTSKPVNLLSGEDDWGYIEVDGVSYLVEFIIY